MREWRADYLSSRSNPRVAAAAKLADKKERERQAAFLAEGIKLAREALSSAPRFVKEIFVSERAAETSEGVRALASEAAEAGVRVTLLSEPAFEKISTEKSPEGVIAAVGYLTELHVRGDLSRWQVNKRLLMLNEIRDPGNLGTILRSAEALGVHGVILSRCADLYQPKVVRAAMGTLFRLPVFLTDDGEAAAQALKAAGRRVLAASLGEHALTLGSYEIKESDCPVIGNEGHGLSTAMLESASASVRIPMSGGTESLNAAAAAACFLWEYARREAN